MKVIGKTAIFFVAIFLAILLIPSVQGAAHGANFDHLYDKLSDDVIALYESEIAQKQVVSNLSNEHLKRLSARLNTCEQKTKTILLLQDLIRQNGDCATLDELASMGDIQLLMFGKRHVDKYLDSLPPQRASQLKEQFLVLIKK